MFLLKSFLYQTLKGIFHLAVIICVCVCVFPGCVHHQWAGAEVSHPSTDESLLLQHLQRKLKAAERCCFIDSWLRFLFFYILLRCYCVLHLLFVEFHFMSVFTPIKNNIKTSITVCIIGHLPLCTNTWWFSAGVPSSYCLTWMNLIFLYL